MVDITNVRASGNVSELKTGAWKKQLNQLEDGTYLVEMYWLPWRAEAPRNDHWSKIFAYEAEAERCYTRIHTKLDGQQMLFASKEKRK